jgi:hypothetical protein
MILIANIDGLREIISCFNPPGSLCKQAFATINGEELLGSAMA